MYNQRKHQRMVAIARYLSQGRFHCMTTTQDQRLTFAKKYAATRTPCSCWRCGNPRRYRGNGSDAKTRQEQISNLQWKEDTYSP